MSLLVEPSRCVYCQARLVQRMTVLCVACDQQCCDFQCLERHADVTHGRAGVEYQRLSRPRPLLAVAVLCVMVASILLLFWLDSGEFIK